MDATYGGATTVAATSNSGLPVTFTSTTPSTCTVSGADVAFVGAGECEIDADQGRDTTTWAAAPRAIKKLTIDAVPLTITAPTGSTPYGTAPAAYAPTYDGFVPGDDPTSLTVQPLCTRSSNSPDVGSYPVTCSGAIESDYNFDYITGTETITPAPLTITASSATTGYGLPVPVITASYSGFTNGDTALATPPTCGTDATDHSDVGHYVTSCTGGADPNYTVTRVDGAISVTTATLIVIASSANRTYGDAAPAIAASYLGLQGDDLAPATPPRCTSSVDVSSHPGDYVSTCYALEPGRHVPGGLFRRIRCGLHDRLPLRIGIGGSVATDRYRLKRAHPVGLLCAGSRANLLWPRARPAGAGAASRLPHVCHLAQPRRHLRDDVF